MHVYGVKRQCALTAKLKYFHVLSGYPPDVLHDLFEGIALCLSVHSEQILHFLRAEQMHQRVPL